MTKAKPLFYAVRRITRGPRGGLQKIEVIATMRARRRAIERAQTPPIDGGREYDVVGITMGHNRFVVLDQVWTSRTSWRATHGR